MAATVEIDKAGRIVIPKKMRDALRLQEGTRLRIENDGERLVLEQDFDEPRLEMRDGLLVMTGGLQGAGRDATSLLDEEREQRMRIVAGLPDGR